MSPLDGRLAIVFCAHHKPWLMMSSLITLLMQDHQDADLYFLYNIDSPGLRQGAGSNRQLSPFDERVREVCRLKRGRVFEIEYENDEALDSGAWYKFIRDGRWRDYGGVLFVGEGTLFARPRLVSGLLQLAERRGAHFIASGHEQRRLPKNSFLAYWSRQPDASDLDREQDRMIAEVFNVFCRDADFRRLFDLWDGSCRMETQHHVPDTGPESAFARRLRDAWLRRLPSPYDDGVGRHGIGSALQPLPFVLDSAVARLNVWRHRGVTDAAEPHVYVDRERRPARTVAAIERMEGVGFHRVEEPEWFGCATNHFMSRTCLERLSRRLEQHRIYDVLTIPFAGTALEVVWGFLPAWLGFEKWFTDGFHRVRKNFVTYRREDHPPEMSSYVNKYYRGDIAVGWERDFLKIRALAPAFERLTAELPAVYFSL